MKKNIATFMLFTIFLAILVFACEPTDQAVVKYVELTYVSTGDTSGDIPAKQKVEENGETYVLDGGLIGPEIIAGKLWQRLEGWTINQDGSGKIYKYGDKITLSEDTTLYAKYTTGDSAIGKIGPAGGLVFYDAGSVQAWGQYLECAPLSTETIKKWGASGTSVDTTTDTGAGADNTTAIITALTGLSETDKAAQYCDSLVYGGKDDWFLPSSGDLEFIYDNLVSQDIGIFNQFSYLSSSQYDVNHAYFVSFSDAGAGYVGSTGKTSDVLVRAIRAY